MRRLPRARGVRLLLLLPRVPGASAVLGVRRSAEARRGAVETPPLLGGGAPGEDPPAASHISAPPPPVSAIQSESLVQMVSAARHGVSLCRASSAMDDSLFKHTGR